MSELEVVALPNGQFAENCYLVADRRTREAVVIDPGDEPDAILDLARDMGVEIKRINGKLLDYDLEDATHKLKDVDVKRAKDALKNDPFFKAHKEWQKAIEQLLKMGVRAEQQALAKWGLNFVIEEYLPRKLKETGKFLP